MRIRFCSGSTAEELDAALAFAPCRCERLGAGSAGPANIRLGVEPSFASVHQATIQCLNEAGLSPRDLGRTVACLALAGASEPSHLDAAQRHQHPYRKAVFVADAQAACIGAHKGGNGGIIVVGTGTIGWAELHGRHYRVGGWGWPISDEGSGAWLGCEGLRRTLWAYDGRIAWTGSAEVLVRKIPVGSACDRALDDRRIAQGFRNIRTGDRRARIGAGDPVAVELLRLAAGHVDALAARLVAFGAERLSLVGGLAASIEPWLADATRLHLVAPLGDAVDGALQLARDAAHIGLDADRSRLRRRR